MLRRHTNFHTNWWPQMYTDPCLCSCKARHLSALWLVPVGSTGRMRSGPCIWPKGREQPGAASGFRLTVYQIHHLQQGWVEPRVEALNVQFFRDSCITPIYECLFQVLIGVHRWHWAGRGKKQHSLITKCCRALLLCCCLILSPGADTLCSSNC
jgi:hypothetical protein